MNTRTATIVITAFIISVSITGTAAAAQPLNRSRTINALEIFRTAKAALLKTQSGIEQHRNFLRNAISVIESRNATIRARWGHKTSVASAIAESERAAKLLRARIKTVSGDNDFRKLTSQIISYRREHTASTAIIAGFIRHAEAALDRATIRLVATKTAADTLDNIPNKLISLITSATKNIETAKLHVSTARKTFQKRPYNAFIIRRELKAAEYALINTYKAFHECPKYLKLKHDK